ncbi:MAG TPA: hypothetical protein VMV31_04835 [Terriglobales bacterium]|nr:hypothetical protein [Terriglobales bacterium]
MFSSAWRQRGAAIAAGLLLGVGAVAQGRALGQPSCLVLPFANHSGDASLDWMGESFVVALRQALEPTPVEVLSRRERAQARRLVGAPAGVELSHATMIGMAQAADADWVVAGSYDYDGSQLRMTGWVLDLRHEHLEPLIEESGGLQQLETLQAALGEAVRREVAPGTAAAAATAALPLSAYEEYVRARTATGAAAQIADLEVAAHLAPQDGRVLLALGQAYLRAGQDQEALAWLQRVGRETPQAATAQFEAGVAAYRLEDYPKAVELFQGLARRLPLPAVVQDLGLARAGARHETVTGKLDTDFAAEGFRELASVVAEVQQAKERELGPRERVREELQQGQRLQAQGGLEAAAQAYQAVIAQAGREQAAELAAAHAGLGEIWEARHDRAQAEKEAVAALAADPNSARARALQKQLGGLHE